MNKFWIWANFESKQPLILSKFSRQKIWENFESKQKLLWGNFEAEQNLDLSKKLFKIWKKNQIQKNRKNKKEKTKIKRVTNGNRPTKKWGKQKKEKNQTGKF
jgi:hypothetical protein